MFFKLKIIAFVFISIFAVGFFSVTAFALPLILPLTPKPTSENTTPKAPLAAPIAPVVDDDACPTPTPDESKEAISDFRLLNVNKERVLPKYYVPSNLVLMDSDKVLASDYVCLEKETLEHLLLMNEQAVKDGVPLYITSSFRGEEDQEVLLEKMIKKYGDDAYKVVALPGQSEHNLGTAVDIAGYEDGKKIPIEKSKQLAWLEKNAKIFGFVRSYPDKKEKITGFRSEPWHWRYVGVSIANGIKESKLTVGEFFDTNKDNIKKIYLSSKISTKDFFKLSDIIYIGG